MGLLTYGLGDNTLLTNGLGGATVIVVPSVKYEGTAGAYVYHKRRVKGLNITNSSKTVLLKELTITKTSELDILSFLKLDHTNKVKVRQMLKTISDDKTHLKVGIFKNINNKLIINAKFLNKYENKTTISGKKFINFLEKKIKIKENKLNKGELTTKHINPTDVLDEIEVTEMMDIIKDMEDADV